MNTNLKQICIGKKQLLGVVMAACCTGPVWAAAGAAGVVCVSDGTPTSTCNNPTAAVTTNNQGINTGTGSITTSGVTSSGTVSGATVTTGGGASMTGGTVTGATVTDGTAAMNGGNITGARNVTASGTIGSATANITGGAASITSGSNNLTVGAGGASLSGGAATVSTAGGTASAVNGTNAVTVNGTGASMTDGKAKVATTGGTASMTAPGTGSALGQVQVSGTQASLTVNNGTATHGLTVTDTAATLSGGTASTTMTLNDTGAHLNNALDMGNNRIGNVADGVNAFDAVNVHQLDGVATKAYSGIAAVAAMASIPAPMPGHNVSMGLGVGHYSGASAVAAGINAHVSERIGLTASLGRSGGHTTSGIGMGVSL